MNFQPHEIVFFNNRIVYLTDKFPQKNESGIHITNTDSLETAIQEIDQNPNLNQVFLYNEDLDDLFNMFKLLFKNIDAAGGVVRNSEGKILIIKRFGKWDLPKGKVEFYERYEEAAIREVCEECGVTELKINHELKPTYHTYWLNDVMVLKKTYWYEMSYDLDERLIPQVDEGISRVEWLSEEEVKSSVYENTYGSIIDVFNEDLSRKKR